VTVTYTQIQYSQLVILNFTGLGWPHISGANLVPAEEIPLDMAAVEAAATAAFQAGAASQAGAH